MPKCLCAETNFVNAPKKKRNRSITLWDVITNKVPLRGKSPFAMLTCSKLNRHQVTSNNHNSTTARLTLIRSKCDCVCVCVCIWVGSFTRWAVLEGMRLCGIDFLYNSVIQWHMISFMVSIVLKSSQSLWLSHSKKSRAKPKLVLSICFFSFFTAVCQLRECLSHWNEPQKMP